MHGTFLIIIMYALLGTVGQLRAVTPAGLRRIQDMDERQAGILWDSCSASWPIKYLWSVFSFLALNTVLLTAQRSQSAIESGAASGAVLVAILTSRVVAPKILRELAARELPPRTAEVSAKRRRRLKQFGLSSMLLFVISMVLTAAGEYSDSSALTTASLILFLVWFLSVLALVWAGAWRYGDEQTSSVDRR